MLASVFGFRHEASPRARRNAALFQLGQFVTQAGDQLFGFGMALETFARTGSAAQVGYVFACTQLGALLGYFLIPYLRPERPQAALVGTDLLSAAITATILFAPDALRLPTLFALGAVRAVNKPLGQAIVPALVDDDRQIKEVNASAQMIFQLATALGLLFAALLGRPESIGWLIGLNAASFVISAALESRYLLRERARGCTVSRSTPVGQLSRLGASLRGSPDVMLALLPGSLLFAVILAINTQLVPIFASIRPGRASYVLAEALVVIGILTASLVIKRGWTSALELRLGGPSAWLWGWGLTGACYVGIGLSPGLLPTFGLLALSAFGDGIGAILQTTALHESADVDRLAEVFGARLLLRNCLRAGVTAAIGVTSDAIGSLPTLAVCGVVIVAVAFLSLSSQVHSDRLHSTRVLPS